MNKKVFFTQISHIASLFIFSACASSSSKMNFAILHQPAGKATQELCSTENLNRASKSIEISWEILQHNPQYRHKDNLLAHISMNEWQLALCQKNDFTHTSDRFQDIISKFPNYPKIDIIIFYYAYTLKQTGDLKTMAQYLNRLVKEYPKSSLRSESYYLLGLMFLEKNDLLAAKTNFIKVKEDIKSSFRPISMYYLSYIQLKIVISELSSDEHIKKESNRKLEEVRKMFFDVLALDITPEITQKCHLALKKIELITLEQASMSQQ